MVNLDSCASCRIIYLTISSSSTYKHCPIIYVPPSAIHNGISISTSIFFLILDPLMSLDWAHSICSWYVGRTISWANSSPPELIPNSATISFNSASCCSPHNARWRLLKQDLFQPKNKILEICHFNFLRSSQCHVRQWSSTFFHYTNNLLLIHLSSISIISHLSTHQSCPIITDSIGCPFLGHQFHSRIRVQLTAHS
jgi:hypothetical protein